MLAQLRKRKRAKGLVFKKAKGKILTKGEEAHILKMARSGMERLEKKYFL